MGTIINVIQQLLENYTDWAACFNGYIFSAPLFSFQLSFLGCHFQN